MNVLGGVEKVAAAHEAREAVGRPQRHTSRANEVDAVDAAMMHYLATEEYRERVGSSHATDGGEWRLDSYESS